MNGAWEQYIDDHIRATCWSIHRMITSYTLDNNKIIGWGQEIITEIFCAKN